MKIKDVKQFSFGVFTLVDSTGAVAQPRPVGIVKDVSIEWSGSTKELRGSNQFPDDVAVTDRKITGKAKLGTIHGAMIASLIPGAQKTAGSTILFSEVVTAAATVTATNVTGHVDLGVIDTNGALMARVASTPSVGQYTVGSGVYGFNGSETGNPTLNYAYTVTTGFTVSHTNTSAGSQANFTLWVGGSYTDNGGTVNRTSYRFYAVKCPKLASALKLDDYAEYDIDFECYADPTTGKTFDASTTA